MIRSILFASKSLCTAALFLALVFIPASAALAVPNISIGDYLAHAGDLVNVTVNVTGGDAIAGLNFSFGTGPFLATPGNPNTGSPGPLITAVDVHWLFAGNDQGQTSSTFLGGRKVKDTDTTVSGTVPAQGILATLTLSTTGLSPGDYELRVRNMASTSGGNTNFVDALANVIIPTAQSGTLHITPEPTTLILGLFALAGLSVMAIRKHRLRQIAR